MSGLLIVNGLVVDGTGAAGRQADLRIRDGRIGEIGPALVPQGEKVIDAAGAVVAPGFIDSHTHYDATIYWDPMLDPMPQHGVTTVVAGNCSLGLAPMRPADRAEQIDVFSYIEDLPSDLLNRVIPWDWESYPEYVRSLGRAPMGVNLATYVGHSQLRCHAMGAAAWERAATPQEVAAMADALDEALAAGALGMSFSLFDKDRAGRPVPSCLADDAEMDALCSRLGRSGAALQFVPGSQTDEIIGHIRWLAGFLGRHGVTGFYNILVDLETEPERSRRIVACLEELHAEGVKVFGLVSPRPVELQIGFAQSICFIDLPAWNRLVQADPEEKRRLARDPDWRAEARAEADTRPSVMFPFRRSELLRINRVGKPGLEQWFGRSLADLVADRGGHVSDVLADWLLENDFDTTLMYAISNTDIDVVAKLLTSPVAVVSASDAGAHLQMFCAAGDATLLLCRHVRERGDMSLEAAVHALTGRQAEVLALGDRGVLAPGKAADLVIFALDELVYGQERPVSDLPGGGTRLTRDPGGYRYTIVNGEVVQQAGKATGALPARWIPRAA